MSYILDALHRADAERERGQVPGLRSRATPWASDPVPRKSPLSWWVAGVLALCGLAVLAWWFWPVASQAPQTTVITAPGTTSSSSPGEQPASGGSTLTSPAAPALPILSPATRPATAPAPDPARTTSTPSPQTAPTSAANDTRPAAQTVAPQPAPEPRIPSFGELSADVRARLPQVSVSGATYSANPAHRMLIVNGQVLQEGDEIQSGLRLLVIGPRSATLEHQGLRYTIGY